MNEQDIIRQAMADKKALDEGRLTPSKITKVKRSKGGVTSFAEVSPEQISRATSLKAARHHSELSQREFAEILGVPLSTYRHYEQAVTLTPIPVLKLAQIAQADPSAVAAVGL